VGGTPLSEVSPTRSAVIEMRDERRAMHEGYVFLDEKCLLLAGEMLRQLDQYAQLQRELLGLHNAAMAALQAAVARHGLQGLQVYPATDLAWAELAISARSLMGVRLQQAQWNAAHASAPAALQPSPEAEACRRAFAALLEASATLAAVGANLERLSAEYQRSVRRARALQDVMLPELDHSIADIESRLEELEQEDAIWRRRGGNNARRG
jgi:V/A-type H+/Na+-transporting ATPase subunit D